MSAQNPAGVEASVPATMKQHARVAATDRHGEDVQPLRTPRCHGRLADKCVWVWSSPPIVHARHRVVGAVAAKLTVHICMFHFAGRVQIEDVDPAGSPRRCRRSATQDADRTRCREVSPIHPAWVGVNSGPIEVWSVVTIVGPAGRTRVSDHILMVDMIIAANAELVRIPRCAIGTCP